jgi:hypothetical protein
MSGSSNFVRGFRRNKAKNSGGTILAVPNVSNDLKIESGSAYLFNTGSSLDWARCRPKIVNAFKSLNCYDYVDCPAALVPAAAPLGAPFPTYPEVLFDEVEPQRVIMVDQKIAAYDASIVTHHANVVAMLNLPATGLTAAERNKKLVEANIELMRGQRLHDTNLDELEKEFISRDSTWRARKKEHETKVSNCIRVFNQTIGPSALSSVQEVLRADRFRQTWALLNEHLSALKGGRSSRSAIIDIVARVVWDGKDFAAHIGYMTTLFDQCALSGFNIDDELKINYLTKSFLRSKNGMFNMIITVFDAETDKSYADLVSRLQVKASAERINVAVSSDGKHEYVAVAAAGAKRAKSAKKQKKLKNESAHTTTASGKKICGHCGKPGHVESTCWQKNKCSECGKYGHDKRNFPAVRNMLQSYMAEHEDFSDSDEVSLAKTLDKNPKKRKAAASP